MANSLAARTAAGRATCILVVDDDPYIVNFIRHGLAHEGFEVITASDGASALALAQAEAPDLVILDVMLPDLDGICVCTRLRRSLSVPVIMLSAKTSIPDRVAGLESGADDYVPKPFAFEELLARIDAILRRLSPDKRQVMVLGDLMLDARRREARLAGTLLDLTKREYQVLEFLMRHSRSVVREDTILEQVWGHDYEGESNVVEVFVRYLRRKLAKQGAPHLIRTVRGVGYMISD